MKLRGKLLSGAWLVYFVLAIASNRFLGPSGFDETWEKIAIMGTPGILILISAWAAITWDYDRS